MDIWEISSLKLFLLFFVPGFISLKVYGLMIASDKLDFSKSVFEAIAYSCFNFALFFPVLVLIHNGDFEINHTFWYTLIMGVLLFLTPIAWPIVFVKLTKASWIKKHILSLDKSPWDYYFSRKKGSWVIVRLKSGIEIAGVYSTNSFASAYPSDEQIYLEKQWELDSTGKFVREINRSDGIILFSKEIEHIRFYN